MHNFKGLTENPWKKKKEIEKKERGPKTEGRKDGIEY